MRTGVISGAMVWWGLALSALLAPAIGLAADRPSNEALKDAPNLPAPPSATIDNQLVIGGDQMRARQLGTRLSATVFVNRRGPFQFLVDSGADTSAVSSRVATKLELPVTTPVLLNSTTGRSIVDRVRVDELALGSSTLTALNVAALKESDVGADGLIGIDALAGQRVMLDFEKHLIRVDDARERPEFLKGAIVIVAKRRKGQLILTEVDAAGVKLDAIIDTGSEITIGNHALRERLARNSKLFSVEVVGVTGVPLMMDVAQVAELKLGPVTVRNVPIAFADAPPFALFGMSDEPALLLGTDLLSTFRRVSLDFKSRKVRFQLRHCHGTVRVGMWPVASRTKLLAGTGDACTR